MEPNITLFVELNLLSGEDEMQSEDFWTQMCDVPPPGPLRRYLFRLVYFSKSISSDPAGRSIACNCSPHAHDISKLLSTCYTQPHKCIRGQEMQESNAEINACHFLQVAVIGSCYALNYIN